METEAPGGALAILIKAVVGAGGGCNFQTTKPIMATTTIAAIATMATGKRFGLAEAIADNCASNPAPALTVVPDCSNAFLTDCPMRCQSACFLASANSIHWVAP